MPHISTLIADMNATVSKPGWLTEEMAHELGKQTSTRLYGQFKERTEAPTLRLSRMGSQCPRALWASIHAPDTAERLPPQALIKYSYGHQLEAFLIALAKASGHEVTGEQDELRLDGIKGHRDCVIDGCVVDVKSAASLSFQKFRNGSIRYSDSFGYLEQLDGYVVASADDPLVSTKDRGYLLAIDKQLGYMCLYEHTARPDHIRQRIGYYKQIADLAAPPPCECRTVADGESGNMRLAFPFTYNPYKFFCFPHLRTFIYAGENKAPVYLTKVVRTPNVKEVDRNGKTVYN